MALLELIKDTCVVIERSTSINAVDNFTRARIHKSRSFEVKDGGILSLGMDMLRPAEVSKLLVRELAEKNAGSCPKGASPTAAHIKKADPHLGICEIFLNWYKW